MCGTVSEAHSFSRSCVGGEITQLGRGGRVVVAGHEGQGEEPAAVEHGLSLGSRARTRPTAEERRQRLDSFPRKENLQWRRSVPS